MSSWNKKPNGGPAFGEKTGGGSSWNGNAAKKPKTSGPNGNSQDDDEMEMMDTDDMELAFMEADSQVDDDLSACIGQEDESTSTITYSQWERPKVDYDYDPRKNKLTFQQMDLDHYISPKPVVNMPGAQSGSVPVIR